MGSNLGRTLVACGEGKSLCVRPGMGFGVHTALINLHPVSAALKMGSNCVGCTGHKARLETILFMSVNTPSYTICAFIMLLFTIR